MLTVKDCKGEHRYEDAGHHERERIVVTSAIERDDVLDDRPWLAGVRVRVSVNVSVRVRVRTSPNPKPNLGQHG